MTAKRRRWIALRKKWMRDNPTNHEGYYECYICHKWVLPEDMELDHVKSRSRHPELVFDETNLRPSCHKCNHEKGSKDYEE